MIADFYVCPECLYIEFGEVVGEELKSCPKCGNDILSVYASLEAQHLIMDIWNDYGSEFASLATISLAVLDYITSEYATLNVEVRDLTKLLNKDDLISILKNKNKEIFKKVIKILKDNIEPSEPILELEKEVSRT